MFYTRRMGFFVFLAVQMFAISAAKKYQNVSAENILRKHIFSNYDKVVIPTTRDNFLEVYMKLTIKSVDLDYEKSQMILSTWFIAIWNDNRLTWNPDEYGHVDSIIVDHREIWHPDVMAYNNIDANMEDDRTHVNSVLNYNGSVIWVEPVQYSIHCQTDTTLWPHDMHYGVLRLGSWMYKGSLLNLTTDNSEVEFTNEHSEWNIINAVKERREKVFPCCPGELYIDVKYNITIRRKTHPYESVIYIPALCNYFSVASDKLAKKRGKMTDKTFEDTLIILGSTSFNLMTFWLPYTDNQCKLFANLFNALFVALTILVIYLKVPIVTSTVPLIVVYYTYSLALITITILISVIVKSMSMVSKPLPHGITQFLQSSFLVYLGIEKNDTTTDCHMLCESEEINAQTADFDERQKFAKLIDRMCFIVFAFVYLILLLRFMP